MGTPVFDGDFADPFVLIVGGHQLRLRHQHRRRQPPRDRQLRREPRAPTTATRSRRCRRGRRRATSGRRPCTRRTTATSSTTSPGSTTLGRQCVSRAVAAIAGRARSSTTPPGRWCASSTSGGTIDPSIVTDVDGSTWLLFKNDGNCCKITTSLWSQQLTRRRARRRGRADEADRRRSALGGQPHRGAVDGHRRRHLLPLLLGQRLGHRELRRRATPRCESVTGPCTKADGPVDVVHRCSPRAPAARSSSARTAACGWCTTAGSGARSATRRASAASTSTSSRSSTASPTASARRRRGLVVAVAIGAVASCSSPSCVRLPVVGGGGPYVLLRRSGRRPRARGRPRRSAWCRPEVESVLM